MNRMLRRFRVRMSAHGAEVLKLHADLEGLIKMEESAWLFRTAAGMATIVEIGSYRGKSCVLLAKGSEDVGGHVTAIDPHLEFPDDDVVKFSQQDHDALMDAVRRHGVENRVTPVIKTSEDALADWDGRPIDLLWVDGDHRYEAAKFDLERWGRFVRIGGVIAAHDYTHRDEVRRAWDEVVGEDERFGPTHQVRSIAWATRTG